MEILVLSDSHGKVDHMVRAVEQFHPRQVLHLGDCVRDAQALERQFPQLPVTMVPSNCDWGQTGEPERLLEMQIHPPICSALRSFWRIIAHFWQHLHA